MAGIWVFAENREHTTGTLECREEPGSRFWAKLAAFASSTQLAQEYMAHGADEVLLLAPLAEDQPLGILRSRYRRFAAPRGRP